jgi:hypothetical protein
MSKIERKEKRSRRKGLLLSSFHHENPQAVSCHERQDFQGEILLPLLPAL